MIPGIIGHKEVQERLDRAVLQDRLPSAYLFLGPTGLGKTTLAKGLARQINCESQNSCGRCGHCRLFLTDQHPDLLQVQPEGKQIKMAQIKQLISRLSVKPMMAKKRVVVVKQADKLGIEAANAFLKILEEPPLDSLLILTAGDESSLLETLVSRCQRIPFGRLEPQELSALLAQVGEFKPEVQELILAYSEGRLRTDLTEHSEKLLSLESQVAELMEACRPEQWVDRMDWLASLVKQNLEGLFLEFLARWFRDLSFSKAEQPDYCRRPLAAKHLASGSNKLSLQSNLLAFDWVVETQQNLVAQGNRLLGLERLYLRLKQMYFPALS